MQFATDPILRRHVGFLHWSGFRASPSEVAAVDVVLLSHLHHDHTDLPSLRRFGPATTFVVPAGGGSLLRGVVAGAVVELDVGGVTRFGSVGVRATPANHDGGRRGGPSAPALGYLVQGAQSVYVAGDTDRFDGMADIGHAAGPEGLDLALLPVGGWGLTLGSGHLDPDRAAESLQLLRPRVAVPVHWGRLRIPVVWRLRPDRHVTPGQRFARRAAVVAHSCRVLLPAPGEQLCIDP